MISWKKKMALAALLATASGATVYAAPMPVYTLKGLTVTATRQAESTAEAPAYVQVVTEKEIKERNMQNTAQAVASVAGVQVDNSTEGNLSLRGYDSKNVLVLVDGQPMNAAWNGAVDWNMIPVDSIRKIEVVSGASQHFMGVAP